MDLHRILSRLVRLRPGARETLPLRQTAERGLLKMVQGEGVRAVERLVAQLNARGHRFRLLSRSAGVRTWQEEVETGKRTVDIYVASRRTFCLTSLRYVELPRPAKLTPAQAKRHALQERFYDRYMQIGQRAYGNPGCRLSAIDRRLLLVGELEADVNNGGFSQYLDNKGRRRARSAVAALAAIGARKTAAMLEAALEPGVSESRLAALDDRFYKRLEDLAVLAARHAKL
jgi:hypothetical protein